MRLGKRTAKLVREAMVLGFVEGAHWGRWWDGDIDKYPRDSSVFHRVLRAASAHRDLYPTLGRVDSDQYTAPVPPIPAGRPEVNDPAPDT